MRKPPKPGTSIELAIIEDRVSLGQAVLTRLRGRVGGEPPAVPEKTSQWWFMLGWTTRSVAFGLPDDPAAVEAAFVEWMRMRSRLA